MSESEKTPQKDLKKAERLIEECRKNGGIELKLSNLQLSSLPEAVRGLKKLETLDIWETTIYELPSWIDELTSLRRLQLLGNGALHLPESFSKLRHLDHLNISRHKPITGLEVIPRLEKLSQLMLQNMTLTSVSDSLRGSKRLKMLSLLRTHLTELPAWVGDLITLEHLNLESNQLASLPHSLATLTRLRTLNLEGNNFTSLPPVLHRLPALVHLSLEGNHLPIPKEILATNDARKILAYDRKLKEAGGERALNEAKMIIVGRGAVGKTTLVHQLVNGKFVQKHKTKGIKVSDWKVKDGKEEITTHVWDFGGQEIMHGTHQFFLTERALYILVLAGREDREDDDALYWLKMITAFGGGSPVLVVLNKVKEHRFEVDEEALKEKYPNIVGFYETDCKANLGIRKLRQVVEAQICGMESVKKRFPAAWFRIKDELPARAQNFISFDEFRKVCTELGEKDKKEQENLALFLHVLGIALNYRDDPRLQETSVLNPHWVTGGIYKIINDDKIMQRRGVLRRADLARILPKTDYPEDKHDFLLLLMKKFELCFPLDDAGKEWLIPELLSKKGPKLGEEFDPKRALCFEYHYETLLPHGLIPRFISRAYTRIVDDLRWRTGVVVEWCGAKALVRADSDMRRVEIRVKGGDMECIEALEWVRGHFDEIHKHFKNLGCREMIRLPDMPNIFVAVARIARARLRHKNLIEVECGDNEIDVEILPLLRRFFGHARDVHDETIRMTMGGKR